MKLTTFSVITEIVEKREQSIVIICFHITLNTNIVKRSIVLLSKNIINTNKDTDIIKVITGSENITNFMLRSYPREKGKMDICYDSIGPGIISTDNRIMNAVLELIKRGIKIRLIKDVTKENIDYCKELLKVCGIRHIEGIKGNFGIIDEKEYVCSSSHKQRIRSPKSDYL